MYYSCSFFPPSLLRRGLPGACPWPRIPNPLSFTPFGFLFCLSLSVCRSTFYSFLQEQKRSVFVCAWRGRVVVAVAVAVAVIHLNS
jgi:hypothetical protein